MPADANDAPYLDYEPVDPDDRTGLSELLDGDWITTALSSTARTHAIGNLAGPHYDEVRRITEDRVARIRAAVTERLTVEINDWDARASEAKSKELQGKKPRGGFTSGHARNIADELQARLERRNRQLDQELDLANQPPAVVGGAIVIPQGLLDRLAGERSHAPQTYAKEVEEVDRRAVAAVPRRGEGARPRADRDATPQSWLRHREPRSGHRRSVLHRGEGDGSRGQTQSM